MFLPGKHFKNNIPYTWLSYLASRRFSDNHIFWATQHGGACSQFSAISSLGSDCLHPCSKPFGLQLLWLLYSIPESSLLFGAGFFQFKECNITWRSYYRSLFHNGWNKGPTSGYKEDSGDAQIAGISVGRLGKWKNPFAFIPLSTDLKWTHQCQIFSWRACW